MLNDLIINKLKGIIKLLGIIETDELYYKSKRRKIYNFSEYFLPIVLLRDEQSKFANKLKNIENDIKSIEKKVLFK